MGVKYDFFVSTSKKINLLSKIKKYAFKFHKSYFYLISPKLRCIS